MRRSWHSRVEVFMYSRLTNEDDANEEDIANQRVQGEAARGCLAVPLFARPFTAVY